MANEGEACIAYELVEDEDRLMSLEELYQLYQLFSDAGFGLPLLERDGNTLIFEGLEVLVIEEGSYLNPELIDYFEAKNMTVTEAKQFLGEKIRAKVTKMHEMGYCHGQLEEFYVYYKIVDKDVEVFLTGFENTFSIAESRNDPRVQEYILCFDYPEWARSKFTDDMAWDDRYDAFIALDLDWDQRIC
jgi:hypothetical protein